MYSSQPGSKMVEAKFAEVVQPAAPPSPLRPATLLSVPSSRIARALPVGRLTSPACVPRSTRRNVSGRDA